MGKNSKEQQPKPEISEESVKELNKELDDLQREAGGLKTSDQAVEDLIKKISGLIFSVTNEKGELQRFKKDKNRFNKKLTSIAKEIKKIKEELARLKNLPPEMPAVKAEEKKEADADQAEIKKLEAESANDQELKDYEEDYLDAKRSVEEFSNHLEVHDLEKDNQDAVDNLMDELLALNKLREEKKHTDFKNKYHELLDKIAGLYLVVEVKEKTEKEPKEEKAPAPAPATKPAAKKAEVPEQKIDKEEILENLEDAEDKWHIMETVGVKLLDREKRQETNELTKRIGQILRLADDAYRSGFYNEVAEQMKRFSRSLDQLLAKVPAEVKKEFESQWAGNAPSWEKEEKPPAKETYEKELADIDNRKTRLKLLERILRQYHHAQNKNYNFNETNSSLKIDIALRSLDLARKNLSDNNSSAYKKNIEKAIKYTDEAWETIPAKIKKDITKEFDDRMAGKETAGVTQERKEFEESIDRFEKSTSDYERVAVGIKYDNAYIEKLKQINKRNNPAEVIAPAAEEKKSTPEPKKEETVTEDLVLEEEPAVSAEEINARQEAAANKIPFKIYEAPESAQTAPADLAATTAEASAPEVAPKRGLWERFKGGVSQVFNRETGKVAGKVTYSSIASATGYKLVTDAVYGAGTWAYGLITGKKDAAKGDIAEWLRGRKETQSAKDYITMAYQDLLVSLEKIREKKDLAEHEKIENRIVNFREKIESAKIAPEAKKALLDKLLEISEKHKQEIGAVAQERNKEVQKILDAYLHAKVSGMQIARDAMNFALTASGFLMLRGLMYAGVSAVERARRAKREYAKQTAEQGAKKSELGFVAKDIMVNAAIETAHGLTGGVFSKEKLGAKRRTINFIKSVGTVARGFGIYGVAISSAEAPQHTLDNLISGIKEHGVLSTIYDNSVHNAELIVKNAEHAGHLVAHPTEILEQKTSITPTTEQHEVSLPLHEHQPLAEHTPVAVSQEAPIAEHHETPIQAEMVEHGNHTVAVVELSNKDGILNGVNKIIHNNPNVFVHENGQAWSENEIHTWKVRELKDMGFKIEGDKWGYPMTVHGGAKVEVFTDENGQPHFKLASEEHVTWNKNYHWEETKSAGNTVAEHSGNKADKLINPYPDNKTDQLINPYPDNKTDHLINPYPENAEHPTVVGYHRGVNMPENSTTAENQQFRDLKRQWAAGNISQNEFAKEATRLTKHEVVYRDNQNGDHYFEQSTAPAAEHPTVVEHPVAHKEVRVSSDIKDRAVVHHAASKEKTVVAPAAKVPAEGTSVVPPVEKPLPEKVSATPEVSAEQETVGQFMQEHNTNTKEFINTYDKMVDRTIDHLQSSFILRGDARDFLHDKVASLYSDTGITPENFRSNNQLSKESLSMMQSILNAENKFKAHQSGWLKTFSDTMFDKNDKDMGLVLTTHRDVAAHPILANGSHGVRVWDAAKKKDIFIYAKDTTFTTEKKGRLVAEYADGSKDSFTQAELIRMSKVE